MGDRTDGLPEVNGVFKGGGPKGAAYAGVLHELEGRVAFRAVAGASAGAITAALVAAGYSAQTIEERSLALDFGSLLDERDWSSDNAVRLAFWDYKERESPDMVTRVIAANSELSAMMAVPEKVREEWAKKGWFRYLADYAYWLVDSGDDLARNAITYVLGDTGSWAYSAATALPRMVTYSAEFASSYWIKGETNPLVLKPASAFAPDILVTLLKRNLVGSDLPKAITGKLKDRDSILRILLGLYYLGGAFKGDVALVTIERWLQEGLFGAYDPARTVRFKDLPIPLHIVATDLTNRRLLNFPNDLADAPYHYSDPSGFSVAKAVRASMSLPLVFEPVELRYERPTADTGTRAMLVDGGVLSNYPVHAFMDDPNPTLGFWLGEDLDAIVPNADSTIAGYGGGMIGALQEAHDRTMIRLMGERLITAEIDLRIRLTREEAAVLRTLGRTLQMKIAEADKQDRGVAQWDLSTQLLAVRKQLESGRPCGTLDFALDDRQKADLVANGRAAGRKALRDLAGLRRPTTVTAQ
jgi:predicted acylesterase/phospholipase RssA